MKFTKRNSKYRYEGFMPFEFKNYEDQVAFELWAFGKCGEPYTIQKMYTWNSLHGEKLYLLADETMSDSLKKMYEIYEKEFPK
jgi:hypothetical protein